MIGRLPEAYARLGLEYQGPRTDEDVRYCTDTPILEACASNEIHSAVSDNPNTLAESSQSNARKKHWRRSTTTPHDDLADTNFEITHPHHPLRGQKFKLVTYRHNWGEHRVSVIKMPVTSRISNFGDVPKAAE